MNTFLSFSFKKIERPWWYVTPELPYVRVHESRLGFKPVLPELLETMWCGGQHFMCSGLHSDFGNYSLPTCFKGLSEQEVRGLEGRRGLPALEPVPCSSRSYIGGEGHGHLVYRYTWSIGYCANWCNTPVPSSCHSLVS